MFGADWSGWYMLICLSYLVMRIHCMDRTFTGWRTTARSGNDNLRALEITKMLNGFEFEWTLMLFDHIWSTKVIKSHKNQLFVPCSSCLILFARCGFYTALKVSSITLTTAKVLWRCWWTSSNWSNLSKSEVALTCFPVSARPAFFLFSQSMPASFVSI